MARIKKFKPNPAQTLGGAGWPAGLTHFDSTIQHSLSPTRVGEGITYTFRIKHVRNERETNVMGWRQPMIIKGGIMRGRIISRSCSIGITRGEKELALKYINRCPNRKVLPPMINLERRLS